MPTEDSGTPSFVTGFSLGLIAGAAGFILFGTKKGVQLRRQLQQAFAEAYREELAAGDELGAPASLREFLSAAVDKVKAELKLANPPSGAQAGKNTASAKTKSGKQKAGSTKSKFKNT